MCLGIPGLIVELSPEHEHLAVVEIDGVRRQVNLGLLEEDGVLTVGPGDHVLIHVGFAMARIDEDEAAMALAALRMLGGLYDEELDAVRGSPWERRAP